MMARKAERKDFYALLGVEPYASAMEIKRAFRDLARLWHPDANLDNTLNAEIKFKEIQEAYETLGDTDKRSKYDMLTGARWTSGKRPQKATRPVEPPEPVKDRSSHTDIQTTTSKVEERLADKSFDGFTDHFSAHFDAKTQKKEPIRRTARVQRPHQSSAASSPFQPHILEPVQQSREPINVNLSATLVLTLKEVYTASSKTVSISVDGPCPRCRAIGLDSLGTCARCKGVSRIQTVKEFEVSYPAGVHDGEKITLRGEGLRDEVTGNHGDLVVSISVLEDPNFVRNNDDIQSDIAVNVIDMILGTRLDIATLGGNVAVTIPPGLESGTIIRLTDKGMPCRSGGFGDHLIHVTGSIPQNLTNKQKALLEQVREG